MGQKIIERNQPCFDQENCGSSDARQVYEDGISFCFSCSKQWDKDGNPYTPKAAVAKDSNYQVKNQMQKLASLVDLRSGAIPDLKIPKEVTEFYGVKLEFDTAGRITHHYYRYDEDSFKVRRVADKQFWWVGEKVNKLFGIDKFEARGGGKRVIICEGEKDTLAMQTASRMHYNTFYPILGISSSKDLDGIIEAREWLRTFNEVIIAFDNDKAGKEATLEAVKIVGLDKAKIMPLEENDVFDEFNKRGVEALLKLVYSSAPYVPSGILGSDDLWQALVELDSIKSVPYPPCLNGLNEKLKGMRPHQITLFISGTGSGKSTMLREVALHILETTDEKCGGVYLEESPGETARLFSGMAIKRNPAAEEVPVTDLRVGFDNVFSEDRLKIIDHDGSFSDGSILDKIEYLCLIGCRYIILDHITLLVSEGAEGATGNDATNKVMNQLARIVKRYPVWVGLVSHLRKSQSGGRPFEEGHLPGIDDIYGAGSIKQISYDIVSFARNITAAEDTVRNTIEMCVLKCRQTGLTGPVPGAMYDFPTGRLQYTAFVPKELPPEDKFQKTHTEVVHPQAAPSITPVKTLQAPTQPTQSGDINDTTV